MNDYLAITPYYVWDSGRSGRKSGELDRRWLNLCVNPFGEITDENAQDYLDRCGNIGALYGDILHTQKLSRYDVYDTNLWSVQNMANTVGNFILSLEDSLAYECSDIVEFSLNLHGGKVLKLYCYLFGDTSAEHVWLLHKKHLEKYAWYFDIYYNDIVRPDWATPDVAAHMLNFYDVVYFGADIEHSYMQEYVWWLRPKKDKGHYVYTLSDPRDMRVFYVGYTADVEKRYKQYMTAAHTENLREAINNIIYECNCGPKMEVVYTGTSKSDALEKEKEMIEYYSSYYDLENRA